MYVYYGEQTFVPGHACSRNTVKYELFVNSFCVDKMSGQLLSTASSPDINQSGDTIAIHVIGNYSLWVQYEFILGMHGRYTIVHHMLGTLDGIKLWQIMT